MTKNILFPLTYNKNILINQKGFLPLRCNMVECANVCFFCFEQIQSLCPDNLYKYEIEYHCIGKAGAGHS